MPTVQREPPAMPMRPQSAKAKGRRAQQRIAQAILKAFPHLQPDDVRSTSMGAAGEDILLSTRARETIPLSVESKNTERLNVWSCIQQCEANTPQGATPCLVFTRNHAKTYAVVPWDVLLDLYRRLGSAGSELPPRLAQLLGELATFAPRASPEEAGADDGDSVEGDA